MIEQHDQWSKMGEEYLGEMNIKFAEKAGPMVLMKAIINDYWADCLEKHTLEWNAEHINMVMSKLYWCWVAWLEQEHGVE